MAIKKCYYHLSHFVIDDAHGEIVENNAHETGFLMRPEESYSVSQF